MRPFVWTVLASTCLLAACAGNDDDDSDAAGVQGDPMVVVGDASAVDCGEAWAAEWAAFEQEVFERVNEVRLTGTTCGGQSRPAVAPFELNAVLTCAARAHSKDMGDEDYFDHTSLDGRSPFDRMEDAGYSFRGAAENIAVGQRTPEAVMESWLSSTGHCNNIMGNYVHIGVGYYDGAEAPLWTQNFGTPSTR